MDLSDGPLIPIDELKDTLSDRFPALQLHTIGIRSGCIIIEVDLITGRGPNPDETLCNSEIQDLDGIAEVLLDAISGMRLSSSGESLAAIAVCFVVECLPTFMIYS